MLRCVTLADQRRAFPPLPRLRCEFRDDLFRDWVGSLAAEVAVRLLAPRHYPTLLMRFTHSFLNFCGGTIGPLHFSPVPTHPRQAFPFIDEILNLARTIAKRPVAHADHGKERVFSRRMIPNPILGHVQSSSDIFRSKEWIDLLVVFDRRRILLPWLMCLTTFGKAM